ncbi:MAG: protein translocase subunit SecD [Candidatus Wolfebacteria bacterium]|nr:protein translocase subunit SecD [Candidatus Wolfebacteria bacterium]MDP2704228.1 protein translocase subunit SecD [bacterium]
MKNTRLLLVLVIILAIAAGVFSYQPLWQKISASRPWSLGLDIAGGSYLIYNIDTSKISFEEKDLVLNGLRDVIERRVNLFGVSEPRVFIQKGKESSRLVVELAGVKDINEAINQIGTTPFLDFREVFVASSTATSSEPQVEFKETALSGRYIQSAQVLLGEPGVSGGGLGPMVSLNFDKEGAKIFSELTEKNLGKPLAVFLDNELITMPTVQQKIDGGKAQISGSFTVEEAKKLAERFNAGALPAPITLINQQTISPELGKNSLDKAVKAGAVGTLIVIIFMIAYYKKLGIFSSLALLMYIALTLAIFKIIPITLTLAGIAGFILSIGMAVDANILIFERTKEEIKRGLAKRDAIEEGFKRAWTSIRDSNITTIITTIVLYYMTSSFVKGFALALLIGVLVSMFSAITITRTLLRVFVSNPKP